MLVIVYKNKEFHKWAKKEGLNDAQLLKALDEMERGLVEADLGGNIFKKRVSLGQGKRGGARMLMIAHMEPFRDRHNGATRGSA